MGKLLRKNWYLFSLSILLLSAGWIWISAIPIGSTISGEVPAPHPGFFAPEFNLFDINGDEITLSSLRGTPIMLNFWARWCPPCKAEMPAMQLAYEKYKDRGFEIIAINATNQDNLNNAASFILKNDLTFPVLLDSNGQTTEDYQIRSLPTSFFIDRDGRITDVVIGGPLAEALLNIRINELLEDTS